MATIRKAGNGRWLFHSPFAIRYSPFTILFFLFALALSACASTRPVAKIGLLAPFEGVYRQEGYDALTAMRAAIEDSGLDVLPLALDSSRDAVRAGQKVLADPSVVAAVGPYWAVEALSGGSLFEGSYWWHPYAPAGNRAWAGEAVNAARGFAEGEGRRLVLAATPPDWSGLGAETVAEADEVQPGQTVLWLGDAAAGADFAKAVWERLPETPFGLYGAGAETFRQRVGESLLGTLFVVGWIDDDYPAWAAGHLPNTPAAYTVYRLTADVLHRLSGETTTTVWQPAIFIVHNDGSLSLALDR
ncbi:MAG: hypothetical protein KJZ86_12115 [Caldilineaceae bacterium]|nr:hypothetical protein [Caldilineaceae bacterium]HRJ42868.1 hypothetical protein [Caldilineaceae bacterium]